MRPSRGDVAVVIPARNEADRIAATVKAAAGLPGVDIVVVVDDGSRDGTAAVAQGAGAHVMRHSRNRGKAAAMETGAEAVLLIEARSKAAASEAADSHPAGPEAAGPRHLLFLDADLATFIFSLPADFKIRHGWTKWLLRKSMSGILPEGIAWRRDKTGFETPQKSWMQHPVIEEYIHEARRSLVKAGILTGAVLQKKIQPQEVHAAENQDWRYMVIAKCL